MFIIIAFDDLSLRLGNLLCHPSMTPVENHYRLIIQFNWLTETAVH